MTEDPALLEWLLDLSDSLITFRARYMRHARVAGRRRPAAVRRVQPAVGGVPAGKLAKHVPLLPGGACRSSRSSQARARSAATRRRRDRAICSPRQTRLDDLLSDCRTLALQLSDALTPALLQPRLRARRTRRGAVTMSAAFYRDRARHPVRPRGRGGHVAARRLPERRARCRTSTSTRTRSTSSRRRPTIVERTDYFGNPVDQFSIFCGRMRELRVTSHEPGRGPRTRRVRSIRRRAPRGKTSRDASACRRGAPLDESAQFALRLALRAAGRGPGGVRAAVVSGRAAAARRRDRPDAAHPRRIPRSIRRRRPITTPVTRVLAERRGVCQDFAHLQIACLRSLGLAGALRQRLPADRSAAGQPRLIGADASHAWLSVCCPRHGWVDLDPTNAVLAGLRHVTLAWGRDYGDVSPLRGVCSAAASTSSHVGVSVVPVDLPVTAPITTG